MKEKYFVAALFGPAGSGKDSTLASVMSQNSEFNRLISDTTRPPREQEIDGLSYNFITTEEFQKKILNKEMLEYCEFNNWYYGTPISCLKEDAINIGVLNITGIQSLMEDERIFVYPIELKAPNKIRLIRQLNREIEPDCDEIIRRYKADKEDFKNIPFPYFSVDSARPLWQIGEQVTKEIKLAYNNWK